MEVGSLTNNIQIQTKPVQVMTQTLVKDRQSNQEGQKHILEKIKTEPGYIPTIQEEVVIKAIEAANQKVNGGPREFEFSIHEKTKQIMVKVIDTSTKEVIREIPPEKILDMVASMCEAAGLFVDEKR